MEVAVSFLKIILQFKIYLEQCHLPTHVIWCLPFLEVYQLYVLVKFICFLRDVWGAHRSFMWITNSHFLYDLFLHLTLVVEDLIEPDLWLFFYPHCNLTACGRDLSLYWKPLNLQDLNKKPKYLVTFTVGFDQRKNIDAAVKKVLYMDECY